MTYGHLVQTGTKETLKEKIRLAFVHKRYKLTLQINPIEFLVEFDLLSPWTEGRIQGLTLGVKDEWRIMYQNGLLDYKKGVYCKLY